MRQERKPASSGWWEERRGGEKRGEERKGGRVECSIQRKYTEQDSNRDVCEQEVMIKNHTSAIKKE